MIDYQRVVEFLRDFRATPGQQVTDDVRRYASEYAQHCAAANERLRQSSVFLSQGLTSEAIHLAGETPNLLEYVAALDLPDPQQWLEFCNAHDLPVPEPLQIERAGRLSDAYGHEQPMEELLQKHRRLALSRASIKDRLIVMRELSAVDSGSAFWEKDIRAFEKVRMKELKVSFATAMETRDGPALATLTDEVLQTAWMEQPTPDLLAAAQSNKDRLRLIHADTKLRKLLAEIRTAFAARDHAQCSALLQQIPTIIAETNQQGVSAETAAELKPVIAWVKQEDELAEAHAETARAQRRLTEALDVDAPDEELDSLYQKLRTLEPTVPAELEERYQQTIRRRGRAVARKHQLVLVSVVAVLLLVVGGGYYFMRMGLATGWATKIHRAVVAKDVPLTKQLVEEQERRAPQFNTTPEVAAAKQEAAQLVKDFDVDSASLAALLTALDHAQRAAQAAISSPDSKVAELLETARNTEQEVQQAKAADRLTWTDSNKALAGAIARLQSETSQLYDSADKKARAQADDIGTRIDALGASATGPESVDAIAGELNALRSYNGLSKETTDAIASVGERLSTKRTQLGKSVEEAQQLAALRTKAVSSDGWKRALTTFVAAYPEASQNGDFNRAIAAIDSAAACEALAAIQQNWSDGMEVTSETTARGRVDKLKEYLTAYARSPMKPAVDAYSAYLAQAADAVSLKSSWLAGFHDLLASPLITDLKFLTTTDGHRYYVLGDIKEKTQQVGDKTWVSFETIDPMNLAHRKTVTLTPPVKLTSDDPTPAAHVKFAETLAAQLKQVRPENWDTFGINLIDEIARAKDIDLIVRAIMLQQALQTTQQITGWGLGDTYGPATRDLARQEVENIVWYDPSKPVSEVTVNALQQIIDNLPKPEAVIRTLKENKAKLFADASCRFVTTAGLLRDASGAWGVYPVGQVESGNTAWCGGALPADAAQPAAWVKIGRYEGGKFVVDELAVRDLPEGTFVFVRK